ncbi:NPCBM/NEW2 domain-containing protein [Cellulosimicrobium funkei]|uniref:glycoside hydrolase domain-containing protein n=1 Tax=Cellulosimicrobium funkei TaxID=264251 RepID=UPI00203C4D23|nr:glycoside hydrolase domain-containing protein [Cellulosimicrobium funkei]MCM3535436.1 NPCBM/NEW2 domain-containing protein [Cellulosimicrobium funkei]
MRPLLPLSLTAALLVAAVAPAGAVAPGAAASPPPAAAATLPAASAAAPAGPGETLYVVDLATRYTGSHLRYRIPALTTLANGDLLAVYDGRPTMNDLPSNIALLQRRSTDGGATWQDPEVIRSDAAPKGYGDPSVLVDRETGRVFVFYAASVNQGYAGSGTGNADDDPNLLHADYSYSDDDGATWQHRRITSMIKDPAWGGLFAASGEGIQLRHGEHAGRLVQQYTVRASGGNYAVSVYSDDHGETWQRSAPVGPGADENKTVELADGTVLLNSRSAPYRQVATSSDGGATYTRFAPDTELIDPANNGSVVRAFPDAEPDDPRAQVLLFSNTEDTGIRRNLTVKMSCDSGQTWPVRKVVEAGAAGYSTLTPLGDGTSDDELGGSYGLLYERAGYRDISFTSFELGWLDGACAPLTVAAPAPLTAGQPSDVSVTVTNQGQEPTAPGTVTLDEQAGWSAEPAPVPPIDPGASATVTMSVTPPADAAARAHEVSVRYTTGADDATVSSSARPALQVTGGDATPAPAVSVLPVLDAIYTGGADGLLDDQVAPWIRITSTGNVPLTSVTLSGPDNAASCNRTTALAPGASYVCKSVRHPVSQADLDAGSWAPEFTASGTTASGTTVTDTVAMTPVDLTLPAPPGTGASVWVPSGAVESSSFVRVPRAGSPGTPLARATTLRLQVPAAGQASAQLAVTAPQGLTGLSASASALDGPGDAVLPAEAVRVRYPQYIPDRVAGGVVADPLRDVPDVDVAAGHNQPVWFTVAVPPGTAPGAYTGTVAVTADDGSLGTWPLRVDVPDVELRPVAERPFVLDLWAHPDAVADEHGLAPWSEEHWDALRPYLADLAAHGQDVVNAAVVEDPWLVTIDGRRRAQTQSPYRTTIEWIWDGSAFTFDYSVFDRLVTESRAAGVGDTIHAFAMLQFTGSERLVYTDTRTGERVTEDVALGGDRYREAWVAFLRDFRSHLEAKGWFDDTRLAFDERPIATMNVAFDVIEQADPAWSSKVALAANSLAEADIADYISFNYSFLDRVPDSLVRSRVDAGEPTLFYTFYDPVRPNTVTASPPVSTRSLGWVVEQRDLDGYLRWTYNSWPTDVYQNPSFRYGQGDEYIVYPGDEPGDEPVSSVRWELFRDGQDDAEILDLAKERLGADSAVVGTALDAVDPRAEDVPATWAAMVGQRANVLDALAADGGARVTATLADPVAGAGGTTTVDVEVTAGERALTGVRLDLAPRVAGDVEITEPGSTDLAPGESATWQVVVRLPADARNLAVVAGTVVTGDGTPVGSFTAVPLVETAVTAAGPITTVRASSPDAVTPVLLTVPVRNRSSSPETVTLSATDLDHWVAEPVEVELPGSSTTDVQLALDPAGRTGWSTVTATLAHGDAVLATAALDVVSGGVHVSDLDWTAQTNGWGPVERDRSNGEDEAGDGRPLSVGGRTYSKGLGVHAVSAVSFDVPTGCTTLVTDYGIDDEVAGAARVTFEVQGDGGSLWTSGAVTPASGAQYAEVALGDARTATLRVGDGGNGIGQDHADWAGTWLRCDGPGPQDVLTDVRATSRCLAGNAYVALTARNASDEAVDITLRTPYGERTVADVQPGRAAYQSFAVRAASVDAGSASAGTATAAVDADYAAADCS